MKKKKRKCLKMFSTLKKTTTLSRGPFNMPFKIEWFPVGPEAAITFWPDPFS